MNGIDSSAKVKHHIARDTPHNVKRHSFSIKMKKQALSNLRQKGNNTEINSVNNELAVSGYKGNNDHNIFY